MFVYMHATIVFIPQLQSEPQEESARVAMPTASVFHFAYCIVLSRELQD